MTRPRTLSPRNSSRSFEAPRVLAPEVWVRAAAKQFRFAETVADGVLAVFENGSFAVAGRGVRGRHEIACGSKNGTNNSDGCHKKVSLRAGGVNALMMEACIVHPCILASFAFSSGNSWA